MRVNVSGNNPGAQEPAPSVSVSIVVRLAAWVAGKSDEGGKRAVGGRPTALSQGRP